MKKVMLAFLVTGLVAGLVGCSALDVIGNDAPQSFQAMLELYNEAMPGIVSAADSSDGFALGAPDGRARLAWWPRGSSGARYDIALEADIRPFLDAGLDPDKLPADMWASDRLVASVVLGGQEPAGADGATHASAFAEIVRQERSRLSYHAEMDHYSFDLGGGHAFEWAKDTGTNEADIVFVLNPQPLIEAGMDPARVEGWTLTKVTLMGERGKKTEVDRLLKAFDIPL